MYDDQDKHTCSGFWGSFRCAECIDELAWWPLILGLLGGMIVVATFMRIK